MMLTLDEAITHAKEVAKANRDKAEGYSRGEDYEQIKANECTTCAEDHEQLASWLEELKRYKAQKLVIKVDYNKAHALKDLLRHSQFGLSYPDGQYEVVPLVSGGPSDEEHERSCKETADMLQIILDQSEHFEYADAKEKDIKSGVLVKDIHFDGSYNWVIGQAIELLRGESL